MENNTQPNIIINNVNANANTTQAAPFMKTINKWTAFLLCLFLGMFGAHKFYEGKVAGGILYLCTFGLFTIGWFVDCILILCKSNPYYVLKK